MGASIKLKIILFTLTLALIIALVVGFSVERIAAGPADSGELRNQTIAIIAATFILIAVAAIIFSYTLLRPVDELMIGIQLVSAGRLDQRIRRTSSDELGRLVDSFNSMILKMKRSGEQRTRFSTIARVEKQKAELIIDSMADGVIVTDASHNIVLLNSAAAELFELQAEKVLGKSIMNVLKRFRLERLFNDYPDIGDSILPQRRKFVTVREIEISSPSRKVLKVTIAPLRNESSMVIGMVAVFVDFTRLKEIDEMKTDFVSTVSHELRTPLTSIKGYAALLKDERLGTLSDSQKKAAEVIDIESDRLTSLINDILDLSKLEAGKARMSFTECSIEECIDSSRILSTAKGKGITVRRMIPPNLPKLMLDKPKIIQVFNNLFSNAIKFTKPGGRITVKAMSKKDLVQVDISDTGIGIPRKEIPRMFNKFYQVESHLTRNQGGTGLGLPIVKEIVGLHHGLIGIKSALKKGTTISVAFPKLPIAAFEPDKCWDRRNCVKLKCPAYQSDDRRCWLFIGTHCKKNSHEPCLDKIDICKHCEVYKRGLVHEKA